jgi:hypothetical protein
LPENTKGRYNVKDKGCMEHRHEFGGGGECNGGPIPLQDFFYLASEAEFFVSKRVT